MDDKSDSRIPEMSNRSAASPALALMPLVVEGQRIVATVETRPVGEIETDLGFTAREIAAAFGVPRRMLGRGELGR